MARSIQSPTGFLLFSLFFAATTLIAIVFGFGWYMSPLWLGFSDRTTDSVRLHWAQSAYYVSYFCGIPLLVVGQVASALLEAKGRHRLAFLVPTVSILAFSASAAIVLLLFLGQP